MPLLIGRPATGLITFPSRPIVCNELLVQALISLRHDPQLETLQGPRGRSLSHGQPGPGVLEHVTHGLGQGPCVPGRHEQPAPPPHPPPPPPPPHAAPTAHRAAPRRRPRPAPTAARPRRGVEPPGLPAAIASKTASGLPS